MRIRSIVQCVCAAILGVVAGGALADVKIGPARTGKFQITFLEESPLSAPTEMEKRFKLKNQFRKKRTYSIKSELFEVYVPTTYRTWQPHGLLVWMDSSDLGVIPEDWHKVMDKYHLIGIGAVKAGSAHDVFYRRMPLALDAVHNIQKLYKIDSERVYLVGHREAGHCASQLVVPYSDVFTGGLFIGGVTFWKRTEGNDERDFKVGMEPRTKYISIARKAGRYVIAAGMKDPDRLKIEAIQYDGFRKLFGSKSVHLVDVPELGDKLLPPDWLDESLQLLDQALYKSAGTHRWKGDNFEGDKNYAEAMVRFFLAAVRGDTKSEKKWKELDAQVLAQTDNVKKFVIAKNWYDAYQLASLLVEEYGPDIADNANRIKVRMEAKKVVMNEVNATGILKEVKAGLEGKMTKDEAIPRLQELLKKYPNSKSAGEAEALLTTMGGQLPSRP